MLPRRIDEAGKEPRDKLLRLVHRRRFPFYGSQKPMPVLGDDFIEFVAAPGRNATVPGVGTRTSPAELPTLSPKGVYAANHRRAAAFCIDEP